jgi:CubicO group peptidase (beta-lactamase class C family)
VVYRTFPILFFLACFAAGTLPPRAQNTAPAPNRELTADALRAFADDFVVATMAKYHAPGAACAIVKDGQVIYLRGYGYSNAAARIPVDPARTRFAVGSLTKILTATAIMQLVERGELSLDADVAALLAPGVPIDNPYAPERPVTLRQCLTHTAGFDQRYLGLGVRDPALVPTLQDVLREDRPVCVMPPGEHISYSEAGYMLAGRLIERCSGMRYERYVTERILQPLGMSRSGFPTWQVGRALTSDVSAGYVWEGDHLRVTPPLYVKTVPCGGLLATPQDLAAFIIAQLSDRGSVLKPDSLRLMHERQFGYDAEWDGVALGFYDRRLGGGTTRHRVLAHGGVGPGMTSNLFLLPEEGVGCVFTFNVYDSRVLELPPEAFSRHFFPDAATAAVAPEPADASALEAVVGQYRDVSYSRRTIEKVQYLNEQVTVAPGPAGTLIVSDVNLSEPGRQVFAALGQGRYRQTSGEGRIEIGFRRDANGRVTHLLVGTEAYERLNWAERPSLHRQLFKACALVFAWGGIAWPTLRLGYGWWVRRYRLNGLIIRCRRTAGADRMLAAACLINLLFLFGITFVCSQTTDDAFVCGPPTDVPRMLLLPLLAGLLTLLGSARAAWLLTRARLSRLARLHRAAVAAIAIGFLPLLAYWNLLGFNY